MRKLRAQRELRWHILHAVYEDADIKAALEKKLEVDLGDVVPIRANLQNSLEEKPGCCCCLRTITRGVIYAFIICLILGSPFLSFVAFWFLLAKGIKACCRRRRSSTTDAVEYPGASSNPMHSSDVELKSRNQAPVYVGVPTTVV